MNDGGYGSEFHKLRADGIDDGLAVFGRPAFENIARGFGPRGNERRDVSVIPKLFADFAAQGDSEIWNIQISDKVTAPVIRQTIKRGHGNMPAFSRSSVLFLHIVPPCAPRPVIARSQRVRWLAMTSTIVLALRFLFAPRGSAKSFHERASHKGRRSAERCILRGRSAQSQRCRWAGSRRASFPFVGGRARLPALYRGSRQVFRLGSVRSRASWQRQRITPSPTRAASSWQTGVVAGRASFRTARGRGYEPHPGHRPRSHQSAVTG